MLTDFRFVSWVLFVEGLLKSKADGINLDVVGILDQPLDVQIEPLRNWMKHWLLRSSNIYRKSQYPPC